MYCPKCGNEVNPSWQSCPKCGQALEQPVVVVSGRSRWIPKNTLAIVSYYLGVASFLLCITTGIPAIITGILALGKARKNPDLKGQCHAWVGIVLGSLSIAFLIFGCCMCFWV